MTKLEFNSNIYNEMFNDNAFIDEAESYLNALIDDELEKEDPDFDFIDECIDTIEIIRGKRFTPEIFVAKKDFLNKIIGRKDRKPLVGIVAAAAAFSIAIGGMQIGKNEEIKSLVSELSQYLPFVDHTELTALREVISVSCSFSDDFKDEYVEGEPFDKTGISVIAEYSDGTTENIPLSECTVNYDEGFSKNPGYQTIDVEYMGIGTNFKVRILRDENSVILNSIYAGFPDGVKMSKENLDEIQVYAVYSDGSERLLNSGKYKITVESDDETTDVVTIEYKNCSTTFAIEKEDKQ